MSGSNLTQVKFLIVETVHKKDLNDKVLAEIRQHPVDLSSVPLTFFYCWSTERTNCLSAAIASKCKSEYSAAQQVYKSGSYFYCPALVWLSRKGWHF